MKNISNKDLVQLIEHGARSRDFKSTYVSSVVEEYMKIEKYFDTLSALPIYLSITLPKKIDTKLTNDELVVRFKNKGGELICTLKLKMDDSYRSIIDYCLDTFENYVTFYDRINKINSGEITSQDLRKYKLANL